jgi:hypothetical protein
MEIVSFQTFRDGGTIEITTSDGTKYFIGNKLSNRENKVYSLYPRHEDGDKFLLPNSDELLRKIVNALQKYKSDFYQKSIDHFVNTYLREQREINLNKLDI